MKMTLSYLWTMTALKEPVKSLLAAPPPDDKNQLIWLGVA